jgi:hypothetical protein
MGIFAGIAAALGAVVGSVVASISVLVASVITAVVTALSTVIASITLSIGGIVSTISSALSATILQVSSIVHTATANLLAVCNINYAKLSAYIKAVRSGFAAFLEAIHYKTLLEIHDIAYILSAAYRSMLDKVYGKLGEFSEAIGRTTGFIETAIQLGRSVSLRVSSFLGKSYDLAEIVWLKNFNSLLERINDTSNLYASNPSRIWNDIDELIIIPATDAAAEAQITMFATVKSITDMIKRGDEMLTTVQLNFGAVVDELPAKWRNDILPVVEDVAEDIKKWRDGIFAPTMEVIDKVIDVLYTRTLEAKQTMQDIAARLARGGDLLANIDNLPETERLEQERIIGEISTRTYRRESELWQETVIQESITLESILAAVKFELPPELWFIPEQVGLAVPVGKQAVTKESWFVGDY